MNRGDAGFTLVEVIVGLLVLSFAALALSATLSSAVRSYDRIKNANHHMRAQINFQKTLEELGRQRFWTGDTTVPNGPTTLTFEGGLRVSLIEAGQSEVILEREDSRPEILWQDDRGVKLSVERHAAIYGSANDWGLATKPILHVQVYDGRAWVTLARAGLLVSKPSNCQYDVVKRRCR